MSASRIIAIGDIHGCLNYLKGIMGKLQPCPSDTLIFLGDYIDRGPDIPGTVAYLCEIRDNDIPTVFLRGNHEGMLLDVLEPGPGGHGDAYILKNNGGDVTLQQYGCPPHVVRRLMSPRGSLREMRKALYKYVPEKHLDFLKSTDMYYIRDKYLFVHAGINPRKPLDENTQEDFLWIREPFLSQPHSLPYTIVYGHTPTRERAFAPRIESSEKRLGIDTGAVYGGPLCALTLPEETYTFYPTPPPHF